MVHALSDSSAWEFRGECDHQHCYECERCDSLEGVLRQVAEMQEEMGRLMFAYNGSVCNKQTWKAHSLRSSNQDEAKQHVFQKLDENFALS